MFACVPNNDQVHPISDQRSGASDQRSGATMHVHPESLLIPHYHVQIVSFAIFLGTKPMFLSNCCPITKFACFLIFHSAHVDSDVLFLRKRTSAIMYTFTLLEINHGENSNSSDIFVWVFVFSPLILFYFDFFVRNI